ncbi:hypothetical protein BJY04DRAFT_184637 [Aspergillus karnatakaensis]|uniref:putative PHD finger domain protein n=1 Tax=Aspergillus karnatakaensis TaxID=1810916 RepID=UPI003CCDA522
MARNLRSSSHARSTDSRPSTPAPHTANTSSFTDSTRPRKQRRTGRTSRVPTDPLQDTPVAGQSPLEHSEGIAVNGLNGTHSEEDTGWIEPEPRAPVPSYDDTSWSAVSSSANPVLGTMRPLGTMPSAADLRKVGLVPSKPSTPSILPRKEPQPAVNGEKKDDTPQAPLTPVEEPVPEPIPEPLIHKPTIEEDLAAFKILPVPDSGDADVDVLQAAVESALRLASEADNRAVINGLFRMWELASSDPYALKILDGVCQETPGSPQRSMFQKVMRGAYKELLPEVIAVDEAGVLPAPRRARSASSDSTLSTAKSLDAELYTPVAVSRAPVARVRKGKQTKNAPQKKDIPERRSVFPSRDVQRQRAVEASELSAEAIQAKRTRLRKSLPKIVASESGIRSSLTSDPSSNMSSPGPTTVVSAAGNAGPLRGRSQSLASSEAGDNRRLTPSLSDSERGENNDFCRDCGRSGRLLCCDGCVYSFHFSCLDPPLDPANPPEGDWFCPKCSVSKTLDTLRNGMERVPGKDFALPNRIRDFFAGVRTGDDGKYEEVVALQRINPRAARGSRTGRYDDPFLLRTMDAKGNLIFCTRCGRTTNGVRPIIQCDFCPCAFHMDCVDPPLAVPPTQRPGSDRLHHTWMCPNHTWHDLQYSVTDDEGYEATKRIRRPKNPRYIDIEILPEEDKDEEIEEEDFQGVTYRVSEKGVKLNFIERVKRDNESNKARKLAADNLFAYAKSSFDDLTSEAHAYYASQKPAVPEEDTTVAILNSRTLAEREAAANLISFAQSDQVGLRDEEDGGISLLIDQLRADAPKNLPAPEDEIASLRALQKLIEKRISLLEPQNGTSQPPEAQQPTPSETRWEAPQ